MTTDKPIHNIDGSIITPAEARRMLKEYNLQLKRAEKKREEATPRASADKTPITEDDK